MLNQKQQKGVSLLELLLVLAIIAVITFLGINRYQQQKTAAQAEAVRQNVNLLLNLLDQYYRTYCHSDTIFAVTMDDLKRVYQFKLVDTTLVSSNGYSVQAQYVPYKGTDPNHKPVYQLIVSASLDNVPLASIPYYQTLLGANDDVKGKTLHWQKMPGYTLDTGSNYWIMHYGLGVYKSTVTDPHDNSCAF